MKKITEREEELAGILGADSRFGEVAKLIQGEVSRAQLACYTGVDGMKKISLAPETLRALKGLGERTGISLAECEEFFIGVVEYNTSQII